MSNFNFITDEEFRKSLESDYTEMQSCVENNSWKAAHVLAGSIIEAIIIDCLISDQILSREDALKLDLGTAIKKARESNIISGRNGDLCTVIKDYRNLIHPGRSIRTHDSINKDSANVSMSLVNMVIEEIEKQKIGKYGYTAEQICKKLDTDSRALSIIPHLLRETRQKELERLLLEILPLNFEYEDAYGSGSSLLDSYVKTYRIAFDLAPEELKKKVVRKNISLLKEGTEETITSVWTAFFRASDLRFADIHDIELVKTHLLDRLGSNINISLLEAVQGICKFLANDEVSKFVHPILQVISKYTNSELAGVALRVLTEEYNSADININKLIDKNLEKWIEFYRERGTNDQLICILEDIRSKDEIPF